MLGVDVGGTFTDVVAVRDGRIITTKVPTQRTDTEKLGARGRRAGRRRGRDRLQPREHGRPERDHHAASCRRSRFLTTEGHRDILDVGRTWRPLEALTDPGWRRSFGDAARPLVPRYLRRGVKERLLATGEALIELDEAHARHAARGAQALQRRGRRDLPDQLLRQRRPRGAPARARPRGARRRRRGLDQRRGVAAGQGVPARVDDRRRRLHEADLHEVLRPARRRA